ncbi:ATP-dependent endonuclease [Cronobacter dublinensis]
MRLKSLKVNNFRAINGGNNTLHFNNNNIVFLFGKNNIGKSSILHAYEYFASPTQKALITDFHDYNEHNEIVIEAVYIKEESDNANFLEKGLDKWVGKDNEIRFRKTWYERDKAANKETFNPDEKVNDYVDKGFGGLETILTSATPVIIFIDAIPNIKELTDWLDKQIKNNLLSKIKENYGAEYEDAASAIKRLQNKIESADFLGSISNAANKYFCETFPRFELRIASLPYKETDLSKVFEKDFSVTIGPRSIVANEQEQLVTELEEAAEQVALIKEQIQGIEEHGNNGHSSFVLHGHALIRQALVTLLGIFKNTEKGKKHIILFEEPELYLHPSNKRKFREALYKLADGENYQVICVSHDPQLIDLSKPHTSLARFSECEDGCTEIYQTEEDLFVKDEETKDRVQMLNRFNPHLCESFFADEVILVEGDTEAIVVRELLSKYYPEKEIFVVNTGSKNNIPFFIKALSNFKIKQHIIHDSDERYVYEKGIALLNKNGERRINSAWSMNNTILETMDAAVQRNNFLISRYVSIRNFEHAHGYSYNAEKGKPLSAYEYAQNIDINDNEVSIVKHVKTIVGEIESNIIYDFDYLEKNVQEPY